MPAPVSEGHSGSTLLDAVAPELGVVLDRLWLTARSTVGFAVALLEDTERVVLEANGLAVVDRAPIDRDGIAASCLRFAEQFTVDVASLSDDHRNHLSAALGSDAFTYAQVVWTFDIVSRARSLLEALAPSAPRTWDAATIPTGLAPYADLWEGITILLDAVPGLQELDPVTTDLARLRLANHHDCRLCRSLRSYSALAAGADEDRYRSVAVDNGTRPPAEQAALDLIDAFAWTPAAIPGEVVKQVRSWWTPAQQVELVLDATRNAANKLAVAFAADAPNVTEGIEVYDVAADGTVTYAMTPPPVP